MAEIFCSKTGCENVRGRRGPHCEKHGCVHCGADIVPALARMKEPMCAVCYEGAKQAPAMKKHPKEDLLFHVAIEVDADKLPAEKLRTEVLPGLVRSDGELMDVATFRKMCRQARARGFVVLPACAEINLSGQCRGHAAPKVELSVIAETKERFQHTGWDDTTDPRKLAN